MQDGMNEVIDDSSTGEMEQKEPGLLHLVPFLVNDFSPLETVPILKAWTHATLPSFKARPH